MTYALLDGDIICFKAAVVQQETQTWEGEAVATTMTGTSAAAVDYALDMVRAWTLLAGLKRSVVCFTGANNFRKRLLPTYKANRTAGKPLAYQETVQAIEQRFRTERVEGLEADDLLGILATSLPKYAGSVVVSLDKDMRTFPGRHLNPNKEREPVDVPLKSADYAWMWQTLIGDATDGYKGLPGVGEVKAGAILGPSPDPLARLWGRVARAFVDKGLTQADALVQARMARILRSEDWNRTTKEIRLWHPTAPVWTPVKSTASTTSPQHSEETGKSETANGS